ncbi:hypothetical protein [Pseudomonas sp. H26/SER47-MNA-CIBAN-0231]|jgi:hypothetical protein|uniref:hypothetical protein n=1 Tax=Pseudomonas sp. H26/SER47-MNA-CIBAN-0231 TaxID=3140477 RepID=UPI003326E4E9
MSRTRNEKPVIMPPAPSSKRADGVLSVSMSFESCLVESHKKNDEYVESWVNSEIKKSNSYFKKEIYSEE